MDNEEDLTVKEVAKRSRCNRSAVSRWITHGCEGVKLRARLVGGKWLIKPSDLSAFEKALTDLHLGTDGDEPAPEVVRRDKINARAQAAKERLKARGVPMNT